MNRRDANQLIMGRKTDAQLEAERVEANRLKAVSKPAKKKAVKKKK